MTLEELDQLLEDTRRQARVDDRTTHNLTLATIEIARQLIILNTALKGSPVPGQVAGAKEKGKAAGKR